MYNLPNAIRKGAIATAMYNIKDAAEGIHCDLELSKRDN